jgi:hypothetical protein
MKNTNKDDRLLGFFGDRFHKWTFLFCTVISIGLIIASFFIPPLAVIDGSVLAAVGEIFGFAALGEVGAAIERGHTASISHGNTTIEIKKEDDDMDGKEAEYGEE